MSNFSELQLRRFRFIFVQHAEDAVVERLKAHINHATPRGAMALSPATSIGIFPSNSNVHSASNAAAMSTAAALFVLDGASSMHSGDATGQQSPSKASSLRMQGKAPTDVDMHTTTVDPQSPVSDLQLRSIYKLSPRELQLLMPRFGPAMSYEVARSIVLRYDSSCTGSLDFVDFIEFLADYKVTLDIKREGARRLFAQRNAFLVQRPAAATTSQVSPDMSPHTRRSVQSSRQSLTPTAAAAGSSTLSHSPQAGPPAVSAQLKELAQALGFQLDHPAGSSFLLAALARASSELDFLTFLNLDDPESLWSSGDALTRAMAETGLVTDYLFLQRTLTIRIIEARGLERFARAKRRPNAAVSYATIDPFVRVTIAGAVKQTSAILGTTRPMWDQELTFPIVIPPGEIHDVVNWISTHDIVLEICDLHNMGPVVHFETLAIGSVPLIQVLMAVQKPYELSVKLVPLDSEINPIRGSQGSITLNLHATDHTQERGAIAKVLDVCPRTEDVWLRKYPDKVRKDLSPAAPEPSSHKKGKDSRATTAVPSADPDSDDSDEEGPDGNFKEYLKSMEQHASASSFWNYYMTIMDTTRQLFPRRNFAILALDESNTFRPLTCFLRPLKLPNQPQEKPSRHELARYVAHIPCYSPWTPLSDATHRALSKLPSAVANTLHHGTQPLADAYLTPVTVAESRFTQVATPASMVARGFGSVMDHAVLLCSLFLGAGSDAYIAFGAIRGRHAVWVVTIDVISPEDQHQHHHHQTPDSRHIGVGNNGSNSAMRRSGSVLDGKDAPFLLRDKLEAARQANAQYKVQRWDVVSGKSWTSMNEGEFAFERIYSVCNHTNIWLNVQPVDMVTAPAYIWDLNNPQAWLPFATSQSAPETKQLMSCIYTYPYSLHDPLLSIVPSSRSTLKSLGKLVQAYRKNQLLCTTQYHRGTSKWLQDQLPKFEAHEVDSLLHPTVAEASAALAADMFQPAATGSSLAVAAMLRGNVAAAASYGPEIPRGCAMHYYVLKLKGRVAAVSILHLLVKHGLVDCSDPGCALALALESFSYPFGAGSVWVGVGVITRI
ncbi:hypothetical protein BC828DRAFT_387180, partial [Blastocladiella britannica]